MRAFASGEPFMHVESFPWIPCGDDIEEMVDDAGGPVPPVFSERYLYPRIGKSDARFVLAVAEEYAKLIEVLGTKEIRRLLHGT